MAEAKEKVETEAKSGMTMKKMIIIWIPLFVVQLVVSYVVVAKFFKPKMNPAMEEIRDESTRQTPQAQIGEWFLMEDVIVNPKATKGARFLSMSVGFECETNQVVKEIEKREILIRDYLISLLSDRTIEQLDDGKDKEILRMEILGHVKEVLATEGLMNVYFETFILQ
jgi:flagellar FliL protein